jgi:fumarate reductase flavoprotein subunit
MAGLCAAARARELGLEVTVFEKGTRPGGSMLLSSCVIWRHRSFEDFRSECPDGDPTLQRLVWDRLDDALAWLESLGAPVVARQTGNARTTGVRFHRRELTDVLVHAAGDVRISTHLGAGAQPPLVLATGGFQGNRDLVNRYIAPGGELVLRANRWSGGDGLLFALERGGALSPGMDEFYGRALPAPPAVVTEDRFVDLAQVYGRHALVVDESGERFAPEPVSWSEVDLVQAMARRPSARAWYVVDEPTLELRVRDRSVGDMVEAARRAGGTVLSPGELPFELPPSSRLAVHVTAAITHTIGGVRVDERARVVRGDGSLVDGVYAAGADAGGVATGGYASGLAAALVLALAAAEDLAAGSDATAA